MSPISARASSCALKLPRLPWHAVPCSTGQAATSNVLKKVDSSNCNKKGTYQNKYPGHFKGYSILARTFYLQQNRGSLTFPLPGLPGGLVSLIFSDELTYPPAKHLQNLQSMQQSRPSPAPRFAPQHTTTTFCICRQSTNGNPVYPQRF